MPLDQATRALQDTAALWSVGVVSPQAVVRCACDALIAGLDSPSLRILAGLTRSEANYCVFEILSAALAELGLEFYPRDSRGGQQAVARALAARALAAQAVSGSLTPRELAAAIHQHFGHSLPLAERLATLDDQYGLGACATMTREEIDQEVIAEARRLAHPRADQRTAHDDQ
ncbi:MAG: hypothetical protein ACRDOA_23290 [Streptosporangiaceae bacterium]